MGKRGGKRGRGRGGRGRDNQRPAIRRDPVVVPKANRLYEKYYNELGIIPEDERDAFWETLRNELPNSWRFTGSKGHAIPVLKRLKSYYIPHIATLTHEGQPVDPPQPLPWYPNEMAWQMTTPKHVVRKYAPFAEFKKYLVSENYVGNISRQEVVSMVPPLVMDVKPGMTVLDLCAAPGSKTAQLIEMVHGGEEARMRKVIKELRQWEGREVSPDGKEIDDEVKEEEQEGDWADDGRATGLVIANDSDYKRAHMLIHQTKRLNSPNLIVTNHDASQFPSIKLPSDPTSEGGSAQNKYLKFDRILADVPCSGDGTPRKNINVWKDWTSLNGIGLHPLQTRILVRALQMLKVGGRVVYSTCSMNPVENEAVVETAIDRCGGSSKVEIVDCSALLPGLKRRPGISSWKVMDKTGRFWDSWEQVVKQQEEFGSEGLGKLFPTMFPRNGAEERLPLERCVRVYPHLQDTGAFFITVLQKKSEIKAKPEGQQPANMSVIDAARSAEVEKDLAIRDAVEDNPGPVMSIINEIESKEPTKSDQAPHIAAADGFVPPAVERAESNPSAAERQNQANVPTAPVSAQKRLIAAEGDVYQAAKRVRVSGDDGAAPGDAAAAPGDEDRIVHYPPPPSAQLEEKDNTRSRSTMNGAPKKEQQFEEPFKYLDSNHAELEGIYRFYGLHERFPRSRFLVRNIEGYPNKTIYYTSALAKGILQENEGSGIKFIHCGIKAFVKQDVPREDVCKWRIQTDGLAMLESWVSEERVVRLHSKKTLRPLLLEMFPRIDGEEWKKLGEVGEQLLDASLGCHVLRVEKGEGDDGFEERMVLPLWRSPASVNLMLPKEDRKAMLLRLYNDETPLQDNAKQRSKDKIEVKAAELEEEEEEEKEEKARANTSSGDEAPEPSGEPDIQDDPSAVGHIRLPNADQEREAELEVGLATGHIDEKYVAEQMVKDAS